MTYFDHTWTLGRLYLDVCGGPVKELGLIASLDPDPDNCWGRRISLHLWILCISVGWD